ncbi:hypothetical protein DICVIV_00362 [Dictyocaulus viviparus]|uniref:Uncharacterized protein n=1 Tax=Dictyocaulus viviparus TaxID=29172 RepID=A0A0D8YBL5_DICVI|nr:hypothetical protein DICVIV_00362 [Dictyocaulus viviparus]
MARKQMRLRAEYKEKLEHDVTDFLDRHKSEAENRYQDLLQKADEVYFTLRDDLRKAAELCLSENCFTIDIASEAVSAFENLAIPVDKPSVGSNDMNGRSLKTPPLQNNMKIANLPSVIHPKVEEIRAHNFRRARGGEVAFSVDGSPIVVLPNTSSDAESLAFRQIMEEDENFSPNSREVVSTFKSLMRKKMSEAQYRVQ